MIGPPAVQQKQLAECPHACKKSYLGRCSKSLMNLTQNGLCCQYLRKRYNTCELVWSHLHIILVEDSLGLGKFEAQFLESLFIS